jgi:hypothetical protein
LIDDATSEVRVEEVDDAEDPRLGNDNATAEAASSAIIIDVVTDVRIE